MALSPDEAQVFHELTVQQLAFGYQDTLMDAYYEGAQRLEHIGLAVPPELRRFETVVNWPALVVDSVAERIRQKSLMLPGEDVADPGLQEGWDGNNLDSEQHLLWNDKLVYGRAFLCLGSNEDDASRPLITVESPREMTVLVDPRRRRVRAGLRLYGGTPEQLQAGPQQNLLPTLATLYLPDVTVWLDREQDGRWVEVDRDAHRLGRVPVVPFINRRRTGRWVGVSEMRRAIPLTDAAVRTLTNLQIAGETHSVPQKWVLGMSKGDFVDAEGSPIPAWQSYFSAIWANQQGPDKAKVGQFEASNLSNFHDTVNHYAGLLAGLYGLPMRYLGQNTANPPSADGIRADEARTVLRAEQHMAADGDQLGRAFAIYLRLRDGEWTTTGDRIKVDWHDAATPTYAAKVDGIQKLTGGRPILSMRGGWDELGWSEARKQRELDYMATEQTDAALDLSALSGFGPQPVPDADAG